jgi:uncharacterized protein
MRGLLTKKGAIGYYYTVMLDQLPELIDPVVFAERTSHLVGSVKFQRMNRLSELLFDKEGEIKVDFHFYKEGKVPTIEGHIEGHLNLICQTCLQSISWNIRKAIKIGMVQSIEQADRLDDSLDPMVVTKGKISLPCIVEDEVMIALPDYPRHTESCMQYTNIEFVEPTIKANAADNPFSVLAKLKNTGVQ